MRVCMPPDITLPPEVATKLGVTRQIQFFDGGQKYVFIVECGKSYCVVKMLKGDPDRDQRELKFYLENEEYNGIPKVIDHFTYNNDLVVIEEYIEGKSLSDHIKAGTYLKNDPMIVKLIYKICAIMDPFWMQGIVHRDLKPDNIIIKHNEDPVVIDFGIYKNPANSTITSTHFQPHSWQFGAPEQLIPDKTSISNRTDYFSIGIISYVLKYGGLPFGDTEEGVKENYASNNLSFYTEPGCIFKKFWEKIFQVSISGRPRNTKLFLEGIEI